MAAGFVMTGGVLVLDFQNAILEAKANNRAIEQGAIDWRILFRSMRIKPIRRDRLMIVVVMILIAVIIIHL